MVARARDEMLRRIARQTLADGRNSSAVASETRALAFISVGRPVIV